MNNRLKFQKALDQVSEVTPLLVGEFQNDFKLKSEEFINEIQDAQYVKVPLVGVFSAGKSSLLNVFTQKPGMLPVDTLPETAVAYELYCGENEIVELYRDGKLLDTKPLSEIKQLKTEPGDVAKVYCQSTPIKDLQERGIILVDMPGIGSGIERHDAAIFNYIHKGTSFVLLVDADQGSLRSGTLSFMQELSQYNMHPAVLVSKIDKKTQKEVNDIVEYIQYQMTRLGDNDPFVSTVCSVDNDLNGFTQYLSSLDAEAMMTEKFGKKFKILVNSVIEQLRIRVELRTKDISNVDERIKSIDEEIKNTKAELPSAGRNADSPEKSTRDIMDKVEEALVAKSTDIAQMIVDKEDQESIKAVIVSTVRTVIIASLKEESEQYSEALGTAVQESIKDIGTVDVDMDFMEDFSDIYEILYEYIDNLLSYGGIWGFIAKQLLPFLPDVLNWLFGKSNEEVLEEVRQKVMDKCVNQVVENIKPTVFKMTVDNQRKIQEKMQTELVAKMEKVKEGLREKIEDANKSKEVVSLELTQLNQAIDKLNSIIANI